MYNGEAMFERYTDEARRAIFYARMDAGRLGSKIINAHHLLLGLARLDEGFANDEHGIREVPANILLDPAAAASLRSAIEHDVSPGEAVPDTTDLPLSAPAMRALKNAAKLARKGSITPLHLWRELLDELDDQAKQVVEAAGITVEAVEQRLLG